MQSRILFRAAKHKSHAFGNALLRRRGASDRDNPVLPGIGPHGRAAHGRPVFADVEAEPRHAPASGPVGSVFFSEGETRMKKVFVCALLAALLAALPAFAQKSYVNGIDPNYPPFAYVDEKTGRPAGFDVDSLNWIAKTMNVEISHKPMAWDGIIPALMGKQIDMVGSGMSITPERAKMVEFSNPYWTVSRVFLVPADSKLTPEDILSQKIKLGVQRGTSEANAVKQEQAEKGYGFELRFYESAPLAVEDLLNGRIQAALMDELPADDAISKGAAVKKAGVHGAPDQFGVAVRKGDKELRAILDEGYRKLMADPYWQELQKKYLHK